MHLMVYAPYGRAGVYMLQEFCRRLGIRATDDGIHDLVAALRMLPSGHPLETLLRHAPDFRDAAALADALLHPQDRAYSVPQLLDFIEHAGLRFGRWVRQAAYSPRCGSVAKIPQASRMTEMPIAAQHAAVELFRGTMIRHSLVAYEADSVDDARRVGFDGDRWRQYVPIRMPETICVMDRVPPGSAAVLINQAHTYTDLFLPINVAEKRLFDAIDGRRSVQEIVAHALPIGHDAAQPDTARTFFERLWWYDQVVFDASRIAVLAKM
jgi:hypothetical protein